MEKSGRELPQMDEHYRDKLLELLIRQLGLITGTIHVFGGKELVTEQLMILLSSIEVAEELGVKLQRERRAQQNRDEQEVKPIIPKKEELN